MKLPKTGLGSFCRPWKMLLSSSDCFFSRNKNQVFLLLHRIRQVLPHDVRILADAALESSSIKNSLCALNHEATNLQQNLHKLMANTSRGYTSLHTSIGCKDDGVQALREGFERKRERETMGREEISSEQHDLARLWGDFIQDQMSTDSVMAKT